jgi:stringent starvation protein B
VSVPVSAVLAIYARETGQGMALPEDTTPGDAGDEPPMPPSDPDGGGEPEPPRRGAHLRIVK